VCWLWTFSNDQKKKKQLQLPLLKRKRSKKRTRSKKKEKKVVVVESSSESSEEEEAPPTPPPKKKNKKKKKTKKEEPEPVPEPEPVVEETKKKKKKGKKEPEPEPPAPELTKKQKKKAAKKAAEAPAPVPVPVVAAPAPVKAKKAKKEKKVEVEEDDWEMVPVANKPQPKKAQVVDGVKKTPTKVVDLGEAVRAVIGKGGSNIQQIQSTSGAKVDIEKNTGKCTITGSEDAVESAYKQICSIVDAEASILNVAIPVPEGRVPAIIGKGGSKIKEIQTLSGCFIKVDKETNSVTAKGSFEQIQKARELIELTLNPPEIVYQTTTNLDLKQLPTGERSMYIIMGQKGVTIQAIERDTGCKLDIDKATHVLAIKGDQLDVVKALNAVTKVLADNGNQDVVAIADKKELGAILGKGGANIRGVQDTSKADCRLNKEGTMVTVTGTKEAVAKAKELIEKLKTGGPVKPIPKAGEKFEEIKIPPAVVGSIIGRQGATINQLQKDSGAQIEIVRDGGVAWVVGAPAAVKAAKTAILEKVAAAEQADKDRVAREEAARKNAEETDKLFDLAGAEPVVADETDEPWGGGDSWGGASDGAAWN